jgi:transcriptional regulator with XRE-family HTH domain
VCDALESGDVEAVVRAIRRARQLTLAELGARCGYSPSTLSRLETGRQPLRDVEVLRPLAGALDVPARLLGVTDMGVWSPTAPRLPARVAATQRPDEEIDPMRRRTLIVGLTGLAGPRSYPPPPSPIR